MGCTRPAGDLLVGVLFVLHNVRLILSSISWKLAFNFDLFSPSTLGVCLNNYEISGCLRCLFVADSRFLFLVV